MTDWMTDTLTDICIPRAAFAAENWKLTDHPGVLFMEEIILWCKFQILFISQFYVVCLMVKLYLKCDIGGHHKIVFGLDLIGKIKCLLNVLLNSK